VRRTLWPLAALGIVVMAAVIGAGCGGTQSSSGTSTAAAVETSSSATAAHTSGARVTGGGVTAREKAVKFSECTGSATFQTRTRRASSLLTGSV